VTTSAAPAEREAAGGGGEPERLVDLIAAAARLLRARDLSPANRRLSAGLQDLVAALGGPPRSGEAGVLADPRVAAGAPDMLRALARAEAAMERHHARRLLRARGRPDPAEHPYHAGYLRLCRAEAALLAAIGWPRRLTIVGSGPFPTSAVLLAGMLGSRVTCIERDPGAAALGAGLIARLGLRGRVATRVADGAWWDYRGEDAVLVAALAEPRPAILARLRGCGVPAVAARSVEGLNALLYPALDQDLIAASGFAVRASTGRRAGVVNTTLLLAPTG
jgi:hypothetical protein